MTKTITLNLTTQDRPLPSGATFAGFKFRLTAASGASAEQITSETVVSFGDATPGTYTASVEAVDQTGQALGDPIVIRVDVAADPVPLTYPAPVGLSAIVT